jgi:membrane peptidoglycan carboxypeptidase
LAATGMAVGGGVLAAGIALPAVSVAASTTKQAKAVLDSVPDDLEIPALSQRSYMYDANGELITEFYAQDRIVVGLDQISEPMQNAVVALEDRRFWEHSGVDLEGMVRAAVTNAAAGQTQGASTLTQQFVKNVLIERAVRAGDTEGVMSAQETSYTRKLKEAKLAVALEQRVGKKKVLEGYLNIAQFGQSVYGVEAAANYYYGIPAKDLNVAQAATIAAVTQSPANLDPAVNPKENQARRDIAIKDMLRDGYITQAQHDEAIATDVTATLKITRSPTGCEAADAKAGAGFFCDYVVQTILNSKEFGETPTERASLLQRGGLHITTTLDFKTQGDAKGAVDRRVAPDDSSGVGVALSAVEPGTGRIIAMAQNRTYKLQAVDSSTTAVNYNANRDMGGATGFQSGSTFKPIVLAEWLEKGHSLRESFDATRTEYGGSLWDARCDPGGKYKVGGSWRVKGSPAHYDAYTATSRSINTAYAAMEMKLDLCDIQDLAAKMGVVRADKAEWQHGPSQVFGSNEVTPLAMAGAYATFANHGEYCVPLALDKVVGPDGTELPIPPKTCTSAISADAAHGVTAALLRVVQGGTGTNAALDDGRPVAGKTGTTDNSMAVWFCGYTPQLAAALWAGDPVNASDGLSGDYAGMFGGTMMARAFKWFMGPAMEGKEVLKFDRPPSEMERAPKVQVPDVITLGTEKAKSRLERAGFKVSVDRDQIPSDTPQGTVLEQSPGAGAWVEPGSTINLKVSSGVPPAPPPTAAPPAAGTG